MTQEQRVERVVRLVKMARDAIRGIHETRVEEVRDAEVHMILRELVTMVARDATELVGVYGTNTHSYTELHIYEEILKSRL